AGYDIAALFGIRNFYEKWGYIPALPEYRITVRTEAITDAQLHHRVVDYTEQYKPAVLRMYNDNNRKRTCAIVRHSKSWKGFTKGTTFRVDATVKVFIDDTGEPCGYVSFDDTDERTAVAEIGYTTPSVFGSMVALIAQRASEHGHEEAYITMPPDHPFAIYLRRYDCNVIERFAKTGGGMMRIINLEKLFAKIAGELSQRLRASTLCNWAGAFGIITDIGSVQVNIASQRVIIEPLSGGATYPTIELPQGKLIQLVVGYCDIATIALDNDVNVSPDLTPLLDALFPLGYPYIWWSDRF
ncbi:MAG TPA: hypothetical protein EYP10_11520, partial [Armatimonadetes bacterium]|nr:hypothetical protein [Armatimonadota bacterium]